MKKLITRRDFLKSCGAAAAGAAAVGVLGACGSSGSSGTGEVVGGMVDEHGEVTDLISAVTTMGELKSFVPYYDSMPNTLVNTVDTLLAADPHNNVYADLAETWEVNDDEDVWTFHLREGVTWVDYEGNYKADVISEDWVYALEWICNFWKNDSYMTTIPLSILKGCSEYYDYTQSLDEDEAMSLGIEKFMEMVEGIEIPDDYTVVYHCINSTPYFESLATSVITIPLSGSLLAELGAKGYKGVTPFTMWYCGPYVFTEYVEDNMRVFSPNPTYWDETCKRFDSWTVLRTESTDTGWELFELGTINVPTMSSATRETIIQDESNPWHDYICLGPDSSVIWSLFFNFAKKNISDNTLDTDWNLAAANENFRKCFYYGLDLYNYEAVWDSIDPPSAVRGTMTAPGISVMEDGTDYATYVMGLTGFNPYENWSREDRDLAQEYQDKAREELTAQGVSFPIHMDIWCGSEQTEQNKGTIIKETIEDGLGTDFVQVEVHTYITSKPSEVYNPSYMSVEVMSYAALYCDPTSYLTMLCDDMNGNAQYADEYGHLAECDNQDVKDLFAEYTEMVRNADAIKGDHNARLEALAEAEAFALNHVMNIPWATNVSRGITLTNDYTKASPVNDTQKTRYINLETNADYYTTEEYDAIRAAYYGN